MLILKVPITTAADDNFILFSEKTSLDISCESSAWQTIHIKCQGLFSLKNKKIFFECRLLQILLGALRVKQKSAFKNGQNIHVILQTAKYTPGPSCSKHR